MTSINPTQRFQNEHWLTSCRERLTCQRNMLFKKSLDINTHASHKQIMKAAFSLTATLFFKFKLKRRRVHMKLTLTNHIVVMVFNIPKIKLKNYFLIETVFTIHLMPKDMSAHYLLAGDKNQSIIHRCRKDQEQTVRFGRKPTAYLRTRFTF